MLKDKKFWYGFLVAYLVAVIYPPQRLMGLGKKNK